MWIGQGLYEAGLLRWHSDLVQTLNITTNGRAAVIKPNDAKEPGICWANISKRDRENGIFEVIPIDGLPEHTDLATLEWVRLDGNVETRLWSTGADGVVESRLLHAKSFASYCRKVVATPRLKWKSNQVYRYGNDSIRFWSGNVSGHRGGPSTTERTSDNEVVSRITFGPETVTGSFIEVVASELGGQDAVTRCGAILGLLTIAFGPAAISEPIFDHQPVASREGVMVDNHESMIDFHYELTVERPFEIEKLVPLGTILNSPNKAILRAMERYGQGVSSQNYELKLLAFYAGIEVIVREFESGQGGVPSIRATFNTHKSAFKTFLNSLNDEALKSKIMGSLGHAGILKSFDFWKAERKFESAEAEQFPTISKRRNELFHTGSPGDLHDLVEISRLLLVQMICIEAGIDPRQPWNRYPALKIGMPLQCDGYGVEKQGDPDVLREKN